MKQALVIDDEPAICRCFESVLRSLNCNTTITASAEDGLRMARENSFDLIVLDVRLPGIDGITALPELRKLTNAAIIVMTAHGTLSTAVSVVQEGAFEYLPKPFELDHVTKIAERALAANENTRNRDTQTGPGQTTKLVGGSLPPIH